MIKKLKIGFKGKNQLPLLLIWIECIEHNEIIYAYVVFNSMNYIGA